MMEEKSYNLVGGFFTKCVSNCGLTNALGLRTLGSPKSRLRKALSIGPTGVSSYKSGGFTLLEILVVVLVLLALGTLAYPSVMHALVRAKGSAETSNLQIIELAKAAFATDNPGVSLVGIEDLAPYLPDNRMPLSPWGTEYLDWDKLEKTTRSMANGYPQFEPNILPLDANGYNDLTVPGYVSLVPLEPDGFEGFPQGQVKYIME